MARRQSNFERHENNRVRSPKNEGRTWHVELSDKCKLVRNHAYFAMATCGGSATKLRTTLLNCVDHFCGRHENCVENSPCKTTGHVPSALLIKDPAAEKLLFSFLRSTTIFKNAEDYIQAKDTYYVKSFNNAMLIYLDKRIHYFDNSYNLRQSLAVLDWNEHVRRQCTSTYIVEDSRHPDRQGGKNKYSKKTFSCIIGGMCQSLIDTLTHFETKISQATDEPIRENGS
ncbi:unnamed protein product [Ixodes pacificus]